MPSNIDNQRRPISVRLFPRAPAASARAAGASHYELHNVRIKQTGVTIQGQQTARRSDAPLSVNGNGPARRAVPLASAFMVA